MFEFVRNHTRLAMAGILLLIVPAFVFVGFENYTSFRDGTSAAVATVDGGSITRGEWDNAHQRVMERARRENPDLDNKGLDTPELRAQTLDQLVRERVLFAAARQMQLAPTDERLKRLFATDPQFAGLRNPDGSVNRELLGMQGMTSETFAQRLRQDLASNQVIGGVARTAFAPVSVAGAAIDPLLQRREVQIQRFDPAAYRTKVNPSDADIEAFYKAELAQFRAPEQAEIEYVVLDLATLAKSVSVSDDELRAYYAANEARFGTPEERRASHVLIKAGADAAAADKAKAKARAEALLAQARQNPAGFAELARKNSEDGSAAQGGDLDFFGRGAMVKPFETAAFTLKQGEISDVFETEFGYHFLTVTGVRGGQKRPFEEVRAQIDAELRQSKAKAEWAKQATDFTNTVYEQSDSLKPAVDKLKLELKTATVQRTPAPGTPAVLAAPKFLDAIFGNEAVANKRNTDAVEVGGNQLVSGRVLKHQPARTLPLAEVKDRVREALVAKQAAALAREEGEKRVAALKQAPGEALPITLTLSRMQTQGAPKSVVDAVLRADADRLPAVVGVDLGVQGYLAVRVNKVLPREPVPAAAGGEEALRAQVAQAWAAAEAEVVMAALKQRYKAEVKPGATLSSDAASGPAR
jgi:peptidyl-prolyl cis-trans isomerase D